MVQYIQNADIWGRVGTGVGQGFADTIPKEVERYRLSQGLKDFAKNSKDMNLMDQMANLYSIPGVTPQIAQMFGDLAKQQAVIKGINARSERSQGQDDQNRRPTGQPRAPGSSGPYNPQDNAGPNAERNVPTPAPRTATTVEAQQAKLHPHISPPGDALRRESDAIYAANPLEYPGGREQAYQFVLAREQADVNRSNQLINQSNLEEEVQGTTENKIAKEITDRVGKNFPSELSKRWTTEAVESIANGENNSDEVKTDVGKKANEAAKQFAAINSWGNRGLMMKNSEELYNSIKEVAKAAKEGDYQKEAADYMIANNGVSPQFAYASMYPVSNNEKLNKMIKDLPQTPWANIISAPNLSKKPVFANPIGRALSAVGLTESDESKMKKATLAIAPRILEKMTDKDSPLSIAWELESKGYDPTVWKEYLLENAERFNLGARQITELGLAQPGRLSQLNDWWFQSLTGVK